MYPGYSGIVQYGHRIFLAIALGFALLVDIFLIANFYWTALLTTSQRNLCLLLLFGTWVALMALASFWQHYLVSTAPEEHDATFRQTLCHYLRGDWFAAESQILPYLKKYPKDIEMLLLQATMYRHTERYEEALLVLDKLQLLQDSRYWHAEIETERTCTAAAMNSANG
jgi:tetratricopeptide (TPR) repeat protein